MPLVPFSELMSAAERGNHAVGYFESWNLESLLAVADAAEAARSPVILGFSGIYLPHPARAVQDRLEPYAALGVEVCRGLSVPACLLFNESPHIEWVNRAVELGFNLVMFSDEALPAADQIPILRALVERAHARGVAVEVELQPLPGVGGALAGDEPADPRLTDPAAARDFVRATGIDSLAVNLGQMHLHGRRTVRLDLDRLQALTSIGVPLALHGATSVNRDDLRAASRRGIRKINVGSLLKQTFFTALREAVGRLEEQSAAPLAGQSVTQGNPYEVIGSGLAADVLVAGRVAMQRVVEELMHLFGSAGGRLPSGN